MKLKQHPTYKTMFYVQWPDGSLSDDFYNKTWAGQHLRDAQARIDATMPFKGPTEPVGAFK